LHFCQFQGLVGLIIITGIAIFKHNLGEVFSPFKLKGGGRGKKIKNQKYILNCSKK
jgi:hypothetical protein